MTARLRVIFYDGRCGRRRGIAPIEVPLTGFGAGDVEAAITAVARKHLVSGAVDTVVAEDDRGGGEFEVAVGFGNVVAVGIWLVVHEPAPAPAPSGRA